MIPTYRSLDSYPFQRNQMPFPYYHQHPGMEPIPPQMTMDPSKSSFPYEQPWPYANTYGHGHPIPTHFCCNHNSFPGYYGYKPYYYTHAPPSPSPMYPSYGEPFFSPYSPQSHYTMELPRYEYDKYMPRERDHHCCGCPNHSCNQKEGKSVKIVEQDPDVGKKEKDDVVPVQLRNYPYPLVWIPPEHYGNKQLKNPSTNEIGEHGKMFHDKNPHGADSFKVDEKTDKEPRVHWNGWLPFDIKSAPNMVQNGDGMRSQKETEKNVMESEDGKMDHGQQSEHKRSEFRFPIIWLPYYNKQEEGGRTDNEKRNSTPECIEEVPHHSFKSVPVKPCVDEGVTNKTDSTNTRASDIAEKVANQRSIPVKKMEPHQEKNDAKGSEKREVNLPVNKKEENVTKEDSHSSTKRGSTSPRNASKLPPVCLRVDPLPRKKNGNGSSRSPSPPASKKHSQETVGETNKAPSSGMNDKAKPDSKSNLKGSPNAGEEVTPKVRTIQESKVSENKDGGCRDESQNQINRPSGVPNTDGRIYKAEDKKEDKEMGNITGEAVEHSVKDTSTPTDQGGKKERVLLDADAAVLIQAAYRGYQVRKREPLKKLKQIAEVSKEVANVRGNVQAFESSSHLQNDEKQKIAIGETIMRLLLKLDTMQGLHPSLRETRKSLARELVTLQERLDSMMANRPQKHMQQLNVQEPVEVSPLINMENKECQQEQQGEKLEAAREDSSKGISDPSDDNLDKHQDQLYLKDGESNLHSNDGESESQSPGELPSNEREEHGELPNGLVEEDISPVVSVDALESTKAEKCEAKSELNEILPAEVDKPDMTDLKELPVGVIDEDVTGETSENKKKDELDSDINALMELPVGLLDEDAATSNIGNDVETHISKDEVLTESEELIKELPVGLLDEDTAKSEVVAAEGGVCNSNEIAGSSTDDGAKENQLEQSVLEEHVEVQSSGDSDGWVKIEFQKEDELKGDEPQDGNVTKLPCLALQVSDPYQGNEHVSLESNGVADILQEPIEFMPQVEENLAQKESGVDGQEEMVARDALANEDNELSDDLLVAKHDEGNGDMKLLEENEKLRKLMKELLQAGNEQLSVISNLTGRVKDLEKKLAKGKRSKKVKTKKNRRLTSKISHYNSDE